MEKEKESVNIEETASAARIRYNAAIKDVVTSARADRDKMIREFRKKLSEDPEKLSAEEIDEAVRKLRKKLNEEISKIEKTARAGRDIAISIINGKKS